MKVKPTDANYNSQSDSVKRSISSSTKQASFTEALKSSETSRRKEACESILQEIDMLSAELKKAPTPAGIKKYRKLITAFIKEAMGQSYELQEDMHWDREGNRKNYILVKQINQSVEELMDAVMNQEKKQINLVARLEEIRGMLVDLYF